MKTTNQIDREANERKAREIANDNCTHICLADCSAESYFSSENDCYKAALQAMKWKDKESKELWRITRNHYQEWAEEQIAKEKQQLIDKAMKVICNGCAQKVECEFNNWKMCSTKDELIKSIKGE